MNICDQALSKQHYNSFYLFPVRNLGCYKDNSRPLKIFYKSFRDDIDWFDMLKTVKECAQEAKNNGYKVTQMFFYIKNQQ